MAMLSELFGSMTHLSSMRSHIYLEDLLTVGCRCSRILNSTNRWHVDDHVSRRVSACQEKYSEKDLQ